MDKRIPHIGELIQSKMDEDGRKAKWLAEKIHCHESNISRIYEKEFIPLEQLIKICIHLELDPFILYSEYIREQSQMQKNKNKGSSTNNISL